MMTTCNYAAVLCKSDRNEYIYQIEELILWVLGILESDSTTGVQFDNYHRFFIWLLSGYRRSCQGTSNMNLYFKKNSFYSGSLLLFVGVMLQ